MHRNKLIQWGLPPKHLSIAGGDVHVWRACIEDAYPALGRLEATLSPDERERAARFRYSRDHDRFVAWRGILRELLGLYRDRPPGSIAFQYAAHGKPTLLGTQDVRFNISHSRDLALFALSAGPELGVDVEWIRPEFGGDDIAERYFSPAEVAALRNLPPEQRTEAFFLCWTRKEAYVKAHGAGLQIPLASFSVSLTPDDPAKLESADTSRWVLHSLDAGIGYAAALVSEAPLDALALWAWHPQHKGEAT